MGKVQKEGRRAPHELSKDNKNQRRDYTHFVFKVPQKIFFAQNHYEKAMKSRFLMIILNIENHGLILINLRHQRQSQTSTSRRFALCRVGLERYIVLGLVTTG